MDDKEKLTASNDMRGIIKHRKDKAKVPASSAAPTAGEDLKVITVSEDEKFPPFRMEDVIDRITKEYPGLIKNIAPFSDGKTDKIKPCHQFNGRGCPHKFAKHPRGETMIVHCCALYHKILGLFQFHSERECTFRDWMRDRKGLVPRDIWRARETAEENRRRKKRLEERERAKEKQEAEHRADERGNPKKHSRDKNRRNV